MKLKLVAWLLVAALVTVLVIFSLPEDKGVKCSVCGMINCTMGCKGTAVSAEGKELMVMPGLPDWLFYVGIGGVFVISFIAAEIVGRRGVSERKSWRLNLLRIRPLKAFIKKPYFQFTLQFPMVVGFLTLICIGLFGHQVINITPALTWTVWWAGLIVLVLFGGKIWCVMCPWDLIATATSYLRLWGGGERRPLNLGLKWPKGIHNIGPAIILFIVLTWFELGYHITTSPRFTAYMAIGILVLAIVPALLFERKGFCRHACFVGRITGLYSTFSPVEVRAADKAVCKTCRTKDCYTGNERANACPTSLCLATLVDNTYCLKCMDCVKSCPHDNVALNIRPFAEDLYNYSGPRMDEAILAVVLLSLTSFHGLTMTPLWENIGQPQGTIVQWIAEAIGTGRLVAFTIGMTAVILAPIIIYLGFCALAWLMARLIPADDSALMKNVSVRDIFVQFSYSVLPIALFYHVAHNGMHLFMEGQNVAILASDPAGQGWDIFGTAGAGTFPPILGKDTIWILQVLCVLVGHVFGIIVSQKTATKLFGKGRLSTLVLVPLLLAMILFSFVSLWIMHLDMNMRGTLM